MVQKMAEYREGSKKQNRTKAANISEQKQQGQGRDMFFQTVHGTGFVDNIFPNKQQVCLYDSRIGQILDL